MEFLIGNSGATGAGVSRRVPLKGGGEASVPSAPQNARPVIILITFLLGENQAAVRLDTQKEMFIDPVPAEVGPPEYVRELASFMSREFREGR